MHNAPLPPREAPEPLRVIRVGGPIGHPDHEGFTVVDHAYREVAPIATFLTHLHNIGRSPYTVRNYAYHLSVFVGYLNRRRIAWDDANNMLRTLGEYAGWLARGDGRVVPLFADNVRTRSTINHHLTSVYGFYKFHQRHGIAVIEKLLSENKRSPYKGFLHGLASGDTQERLVKLNEPKKRVVDLTLEQARAVIDAQTNARDRLLFLLLLTTGMRIGQALGLRHEDINFDTNTVAITAREDNVNGARAKQPADGDGEGLAQIPMAQVLVDAYIEFVQDEAASAGSDYVFVNIGAGVIGAPMTYSNVNALVRRTRKKVGFHFTPHQFRHTFATQCRAAGVDMEVLSALLTHRSIATTIDIYSHLSPELVRQHLIDTGLLYDGPSELSREAIDDATPAAGTEAHGA